MIVKFITLKWGTKYGPEYVNRLYKTISNIYSEKFEFYCYTDNAEGILCNTIDINQLPNFKSNVFTACKLDLFNQLPFEGPYVLLDLDILVLRDLSQYFKHYNFTEPRIIYNYWQEPERIHVSYYTSDCFVNSSFVTWNGNQLKWLHDKFHQYKDIISFKFRSLDKFIFYSSRNQINFHPKKTVYAYSFGADYYEDNEPFILRPDYYISIFNTSHGIPKGLELHEAEGWAKEKWIQYE